MRPSNHGIDQIAEFRWHSNPIVIFSNYYLKVLNSIHSFISPLCSTYSRQMCATPRPTATEWKKRKTKSKKLSSGCGEDIQWARDWDGGGVRRRDEWKTHAHKLKWTTDNDVDCRSMDWNTRTKYGRKWRRIKLHHIDGSSQQPAASHCWEHYVLMKPDDDEKEKKSTRELLLDYFVGFLRAAELFLFGVRLHLNFCTIKHQCMI